jgi:tryptophan-rich sensory protein
MKTKEIISLIVAIITCQAAGIVGSIFTASKIPTWYKGLIKPALNPPSWVFGPVWTTLYLLMGIALYIIWKKGLNTEGVKFALTIFAVQLILNALWSIVFFNMENLGLALINIVLMWLSILWTIVLFYRLSPTAGLLLIPYILWVSFASYLNYAIWTLN